MPLTDDVINRLRSMIQNGELPPGSRLPPEHQLALQMGISRSGVREAVKTLASARVLDVRRGDGTYVTSLAPHLLLEGVGFQREGFARAYLLIDGAWQDHLLFAMLEREFLHETETVDGAERQL